MTTQTSAVKKPLMYNRRVVSPSGAVVTIEVPYDWELWDVEDRTAYVKAYFEAAL